MEHSAILLTFIKLPVVIKIFVLSIFELGDNCIQNFHLGRYVVGYTVGNLVLPRRPSNFRTYIHGYTSQNDIPILMHFCSFISNWSVASRITMKYEVINDVKQFPTIYHRISCRKFLTLSNQMSCDKSKCIRMTVLHRFYCSSPGSGALASQSSSSATNFLNL